MTTMTSKERLHRCYFHQETDRPAVYVRTNYPENDPSYEAVKAYMRANSELKAGWNSTAVEAGIVPEYRTEPVDDDWDRLFTILHTPKGDLIQTTLMSRHPNASGLTEAHFFKDRQDGEKFLSIPMPTFRGDASAFQTKSGEIGDCGIVEVLLGHNPGGSVAEMFGSETFAMMTVTDRDIIHALCEQRMNVLLARIKYILSLGIGPYFSMLGEELIVPPLHGPADFEEFNVRYDKPIIDLIHNAGGRIHIHSHGRIGKVFQQFVDMGVDVLHPVEAPPMGDITAAQAKTISAGKTCIEGNIQIADIYEKPAENLAQQTCDLIRDVFHDRCGLIVSPSASLYYYGKGDVAMQAMQTIVQTVRKYKA